MSARPASPEALLKALGATTFAGSAVVALDKAAGEFARAYPALDKEWRGRGCAMRPFDVLD